MKRVSRHFRPCHQDATHRPAALPEACLQTPELRGTQVPGEQGEVGFRYGPTRFRQDALAAGGGDDRVGLRDALGTHVAGQPNQRGRDVALLDAVRRHPGQPGQQQRR